MGLCWRLVFVGLLVSMFYSTGGREAAAAEPGKESERLLVYIGTGTQGSSKGIYRTWFNPTDGTLAPVAVAAELSNPTFLAVHPQRPLLYAASELSASAGKDARAMSAFAIGPKDGALTPLNQQASGSISECHLAIDHSGQYVLATSYSDGTVTSLPIEADGRLGKLACVVQHKGSSVVPNRQSTPRAHGVYFDAPNHHALVADLGLDKILMYRFDTSNGKLTANEPPSISMAPGAGPRHFAFHPNGRYGYVINEIDSTITAMTYDAERGVLAMLQTVSTLPEQCKERNSTAEIQVHPSGRFLYGSNRGHDSIVAFAIDDQTGKLRLIGHEPTQGKAPRHFMIDPSGKFLLAANQGSDNVVVFQIDAETGKLSATGHTLAAPTPMCIVMLRAPK